MKTVVLRTLWSHWARHPLQLLTLVLGLALATALWSGVQAINGEARASYDQAAQVVSQGAEAQVFRPDGPLSVADFTTLRRAGWLVSPVLEGRVTLGDRSYRVIGTEGLTAANGAGLGVMDSEAAAAFLTPPGVMFASSATIDELEGRPEFPRLERARDLPDGVLLGDIAIAEWLLQRPGQISYLQLLPDQPLGRAALQDVAPDLALRQPGGQTDIARLTDSFHLNLTAFGFLAFAVGLFIVHAFIGLAFEQRRPAFRTLRAIGVPLRTLMALALGELLMLAFLSGLIGLLLGFGLAATLLPDVAATLRGLYGASVDGDLQFRPTWAVAGIAMALLGTLLAAAHAMWKVWSLPLLATAQPRAWARGSRRGAGILVALAVLLLGFAAAVVVFGHGLALGFAGLAALLLGTALLLPGLLSLAMAGLGRTGTGAVWHWFWADGRQQLPGLSLALMALLLALAANIGVSTMVSSFRLTFTGYLDQRLASELYIRLETAEEAEKVQALLRPKVDALLPIWSIPVTIETRAAEVYGIVDHKTYRENWPLLSGVSGVWDRLAAGEGVLINEQLGYRAGIALGQDLTLEPGWNMPVLGIYSDYGNPEGQVIVADAVLTQRYPDIPKLRFGVRTDRAQLPALKQTLEDFGVPPDAITDQAALKAASLEVFERTFTVTGALNILTLAVAGFALLTSFLTLANMRLPQLAPVWALGMTRGALAWLELWRSLALVGFTMVLALPLGLALAWVLLNIINVEAFGWRLPMYLFPADWIRLFALAMVAGVLASLLPVRRLARLPTARLLQVFANER